MERNGEVVAEYSICFSESFRLDRNTFNKESSKMCKDDNSPSLYCNVPNSLKSDISMESEYNAKKSEIVSQLKNQRIEKLNRAETDYINSDEHMLSIIQKQSDHAMNNCYLPAWENSEIRVFPANQDTVDKLMNRNEVYKNNFNADASCTTPHTVTISDSSLDTTSDSFLQNFEDDSSSSVEEIFCPTSSEVNAEKYNDSDRHGPKGSSEESFHAASDPIIDSPSSYDLPKLDSKEESQKIHEPNPNKDRMMPQLIPLIYVEEDDPIKRHKEKRMEESKLADSPEMPKLTAFSSEAEDMFHSKKEFINQKNRLSKCSVQLFASVLEGGSMKAVKEIEYLETQSSCSTSGNSSSVIDILSLETNDENVEGNFSPVLAMVSEILEDASKRERLFQNDCSSTLSVGKSSLTNREKTGNDEMESQDSVNEILQPQVLLRRISLDQCRSLPELEKNVLHEGSSTEELENEDKMSFMSTLPSNDSDDNDSLTDPFKCVESKNSSNETPEIEEIEGVRFFQFRSKSDMEEFHEQIQTKEEDEEMIVPTKTTDITQIKGWRNKYFAPESDFQYPISLEIGDIGSANFHSTSSVPQSSVLSEEEKFFKIHFATKDGTETMVQSDDPKLTKCLADDTKLSGESLNCDATESSSKNKPQVSKDDAPEPFTLIKPSDEKNPMSAFISKELDEFLRKSATLNVSRLQKVNPNIAPIAPDASILKLGKLRKPDHQVTTLAALKIRNGISLGTSSRMSIEIKEKKEEINEPEVDEVHVDVETSESSPIITVTSSSSSSDSSSDDDIPVARLQDNRKRLRSRMNRSMPSRRVKRIKSDISSDQSAQRLVLRLTKESKGTSEGYKVSDISCEKQESELSSSLSSSSSSSSSPCSSESEELPENFKIPDDGKLPIIKETIFLKDNESNLLNEFLINLNTLGTSKDVAMLMQSNQSYFDKGPVLTNIFCTKAIDAVLSNKDLSELKNKPSPKKKLKTWQKYLPKKLSKTQQQKFSKITRAPNVEPQLTEKISNSKDITKPKLPMTEKSSKIPGKNVSSIETSEKNALKSNKTIAKPSAKQHLKTSARVQSQKLASEKVSKIRKSKSTVVADKLSFVERGKRSIRLPARYLDSAVLAAGTEWVSPVFVEDEKKSRKQLLEVLDKISSGKGESDTTTQSEGTKINSESLKKSHDLIVTKNAEKSSSLNAKKTLKQPTKETNSSKSMKTNNSEVNRKSAKETPCKRKRALIKDIDPLEEESEFIDELYPLPTCACSPCTRTVIYDRLSKDFVSFCGHNSIGDKKESNKNSPKLPVILSETLCLDGDKNSSETIKNANTNKSPQSLKSNAVSSSNAKQNSPHSTVVETSPPTNTECTRANDLLVQSSTVSKSSLHDPNVLPESTQAVLKAPAMCNNSNFVLPPQVVSSASSISNSLQQLSGIYDNAPVVSNDLVSGGTVLNVATPNIANQLILLLPVPTTGSATNTVQSISTGLIPNSLSSQTVQNLTTNLISKSSHVVRKVLADKSMLTTHLDVSKSNSEYMLCSKSTAMTPILPKPAKGTPVRLKLSNTTQNMDKNAPVLYGSQSSNTSQEHLLTNSTHILTAQNNTPSSSNPSIPLPSVKAIKLGDQLYLCSSVVKDGEQKSSVIKLSSVSRQSNAKIQPDAEVSAEKTPTQYKQLAIENGVLKTPSANPIECTPSLDVKSSRPKKPSERRRKSPLSKRKFKDDSDSDVDVDVVSVDKTFDARSELKKSIQLMSETDLSDGECDAIFTSAMGNEGVSRIERKKTVIERNRRLIIRKAFEKLKSTSSEVMKAKTCGEILDMTRFMVIEFGKQERAYKCIKRILRLRNVLLLKKLTGILQGCKDANIRMKTKYQVIKSLAVDWENRRQERSPVLSSLRSKPALKSHTLKKKSKLITAFEEAVKTIENVIPEQSVADEVPKLDTVMDAPQLNLKKLFEPVVVTDVTEEPHVQLRILEAPEVTEEMQIDSQFQVIEEKMEIMPQPNLEEKTIDGAKKIQAPAGTSDGNTSDDDLLIIDLSEDHSISTKENSSPLKNSDTNLCKGSVENCATVPLKPAEAAPVRKFPGLIPLFAPNLYGDERVLEAKLRFPQALSEKYMNTDGNKVEKSKSSGPQGLSINNTDRVRFRRTTVAGLSLTPDSSEEIVSTQRRSSENGSDSHTSCLGIDEMQKRGLKSDQTVFPQKSDPKVSPRKALLHSTNVLYKLGNTVKATNKVTPSVPEEITIEDSEDEVMEVAEAHDPQNACSDSSSLRVSASSSTLPTECVTKNPKTESPHL